LSHTAPRSVRLDLIDVEPLESRRLLAAAKVMPIGDSITNAFVGDASYRFWLDKQLDLGGYDVDLVGSRKGVYDDAAPDKQGAPRYLDFDQDHEGNGGVRTDQILADLPRILAANVPDVVLLHAGSNDMFQSFSVDEAIANLGRIIDGFRSANPNVTVLLAQVIPSKVLIENLQALNARIPALAASKNTSQSRVIVVDQFAGFSATADLRDEYHPNLFGENKIAAKWYAALKTVLPAPPAPATQVKYLTELSATSATNGAGPIEINFSAGGTARNDGGAINLNGVSTIRGLGVHAPSDITYALNGQYARFLAGAGVDDEVGTAGSVVFRVYVDDVLRFDSGVMTGATATKQIDVSVAGAQRLRLVVTDAGDGNAADHADWADARLTLPATPQPNPNPNPEPEPEPPPPPPVAPKVTASDFVYKTRPHKLKFTFDANVAGSVGVDDLVVRNLTTRKTIPSSMTAVRYDAASNTAIVTFPGLKHGQLANGKYRAALRAAGISGANGAKLANDHVFEFFFVTGDADHDGTVDRDDFTILRANFKKNGRDFSQGDFNYDGNVNMPDFVLLSRNYGYSVLTNTSSLRGRPLAKLVDALRDVLKSKAAGKENRGRNGDHDDDDDDRGKREDGQREGKREDKQDKKHKSNKGKGKKDR
jgi:lysophospholipase L1-like esterase